MRRFTLVPVALVFLLARAEPPKIEAPSTSKTKWTAEDVVNAESAHGFQLSPDSRWAVWLKETSDKDKGERITNLFRTDLTDGAEVELTRGSDGVQAPKWSPDGKRVAFLSARPPPKGKGDKPKGDDEPKTQLWLIDPFGGEPWPLTEYPRAVAAFDWAGSDALVFAAQEEATHRESTLKDDRKDPSIIVEDEKTEPPVRLFKVAVKTKKVTRLTENKDRIEALVVSPDGRQAVTVHNRSLRYVYDNRHKPALFLHDLEAGTRKPLFAGEPKFNPTAVRWAPDSRGFYVGYEHSSHPLYTMAHVVRLRYVDAKSGEAREVDLGWDRGLTGQFWNEDAPGFVPVADGFLALLADGAHNRAARYVREGMGWKRAWLAGDGVEQLFGLAASADGKAAVYCHSAAAAPPQWFAARLDGPRLVQPREIARLNEGLDGRPRARAEVVRWKGAGGDEVEGVLYYPHDHRPGEKRPLVVTIHGGPFGASVDAWNETWSSAANLFCQRGAFVLRPNYHGSSNYGLAFAESIAGGKEDGGRKYYDLPIQDIESGVDALIARGLVDRERVGVKGWSNGAILTVALLVHSPRFKVAAAGAGGAEWVADWGACEFGDSFDRYYFGASPLEDPERYRNLAPLYQFHKVKTPLLLFQGDADRVVPVHHGWTQFRALQEHKANVRFVLFPGEKHSLKKLAMQRRKLEEELTWFDRHLFRGTPDDEEGLKTDSPLARELRLREAKRDGGRYGIVEKGTLVPETVPWKSVRVGRFEVTGAQFAAFDKAYRVAPGRENYPAGGVTFEEARAYCAWLSEKTGRRYRLPTEEEGEELYDKAEAGENTLDWWAGYAVNPEDAARLRERAARLGGPAPLLREVGFKGGGPDGTLFDLGGNVAEWVRRKDGSGRLMGGSADAPADAKQKDSSAAPAYRGLRVVEEVGK